MVKTFADGAWVMKDGIMQRSGRPSSDRYRLIDQNTPGGIQPLGQTSGWQLTFSDEFKGTSLDPKWITSYPAIPFWDATVPGGHLSNTGEPQAYAPSHVVVGGGQLQLNYTRESTVPGLNDTSGMICSYYSFAQAYGFFQVRALLPTAAGSFPAFWGDQYGPDPAVQVWPPETDFMESKGGTQVGWNIHWGPQGQSSGTGTGFVGASITPGVFHTYGGWLTPGRLRIFIDGNQVGDIQNENVMGTPLYPILNLAGDPQNFPSPSVMPFSLAATHLRVWKAAA